MIPDNYFESVIEDFDLDEQGENYIISVKWGKILGSALDRAQDALDAAVWQSVQQYMPIDTGALISQTNALNATTRGEVFMYPPNSDYGHYQYEGIVYVDPVTNAAGFLTDDGWKSRRGVTKEPSDRKLTYSNPDATAHWAETAIDNHMEEWVNKVKAAISL